MLDSSAKLQRILVVDDDPVILRLLKDELERAGFQVLTATSGQAGYDLASPLQLPEPEQPGHSVLSLHACCAESTPHNGVLFLFGHSSSLAERNLAYPVGQYAATSLS